MLAAGAEDAPYTVALADLIAGFNDADGDTLQVNTLTTSNGTAAQNPDGSWMITPTANFNGAVTLTYTVSDGNGGNLTGQTRGYSVGPANDTPMNLGLTSLGLAGDVLTFREHTAGVVGFLSATDVDGDTLTFATSDTRFVIVGNELRVADAAAFDFERDMAPGTVTITASDGSAVGTPLTLTLALTDTLQDVVPVATIGNDTLMGGGFDDFLSGGNGADNLQGAAGSDYLAGGAGADLILAATGDDTVWGGADDDTVDGGGGNDFVFGETGGDAIYADAGDDSIYGGEDGDVVFGDVGNDLLSGGAGVDYIIGGDGLDAIFGGAGNDYLEGGADTDYFYFGLFGEPLAAGEYDYVIDFQDMQTGAAANDYIVLDATLQASTAIFEQGGVTYIAAPVDGGYHFIQITGTTAANVADNIAWL